MNPFPVVRVAHIETDEHTQPWLITDLWGREAVGFVGGTPKSCKTWLALELAVAVASGRPCLGRFAVAEPGPVLLYAAEDAAQDIHQRVAGIASARSIDFERLAVGLITEPILRLDIDEHQQRLADTVAKVRPRLLVLDPLVRLHRADENSASDVSGLLGFLRLLQREHHIAIALVHHVRKASATQPGQALRGSGDLHAWSDSNLYLLHRKDRLELHAEHRSQPAPDPLVVRLHDDPAHIVVEGSVGHDEPGLQPLHRGIVDALATQPKTRTALREIVAVRNETLGEALTWLQARGHVVRRDGLWGVPRSRH
jgi:RecA-family ATPase